MIEEIKVEMEKMRYVRVCIDSLEFDAKITKLIGRRKRG
jgi:hypothetical protein